MEKELSQNYIDLHQQAIEYAKFLCKESERNAVAAAFIDGARWMAVNIANLIDKPDWMTGVPMSVEDYVVSILKPLY